MSEKIKVSLLIEKNSFTGYDFKIAEGIQNSDFADIVSIITVPAASEASHDNFNDRLYKLYMKLESFLHPGMSAGAKAYNIEDFIRDKTFISLESISQYAGSVNERNPVQRPDILINMSTAEISLEMLSIPAYAIWSVPYLKNESWETSPQKDVFSCKGETCVELREYLIETNQVRIIDSAWFLTSDFSILRNIHTFNGKAASVILANLKRFYRMGQQKFVLYLKEKEVIQSLPANIIKPGLFKFLMQIFSMYFRKIKKLITRFTYEDQWILYYLISKPGEVSFEFTKFKKIVPPPDRFWADPFVVYKDNKYFIFFEEVYFKKNKGHLSVMEMDENENFTSPKTILIKDYHLSYPFIFEKNGVHYMIPETNEKNTIDLYRCTSFPYEWEFSKTLMSNVQAADATVHFYENKYWMFVNINKDPGTSIFSELHLFFADSFDSTDWQPHIQNPVSMDIKNARSAGKIFVSLGEMYRPGQNSTQHYGRGMQIEKIKVLNENIYKTESVKFIYSDWDKNLISTHTLNSAGNMTVIDAQRTRLKWW